MRQDSQLNEVARSRPLANSVLQLIWREKKISRAEIARRTGLSRSTVSEIVATLLATHLVSEVGEGESRGGRRPIVLQFQDDAYAILGVEIGAAHVEVVVTDLRGRVLCDRQRPHPVRSDPDGTRALLRELVAECLADGSAKTHPLIGVGVAMPSPVDPRQPDALSELVLPKWRGRSGLRQLFADYRVPVLIDNDANLGALAEGWWGASRGVDNFAYVKVATGVGSGHVIAGQLYRGATGVAGEIGHLAIDPHGDPCICGLRGCLATLIGQEAILKRTTALLVNFPQSSLAARHLTIDAIAEAALGGDTLALQIVRETAEYLGIAIAGMLNLMNPEMVIIGGDLSRLGELLLEPVRTTVRKRTLVSSVAAAEVVVSELGIQSVAVGAATLVLEAALTDLRFFPSMALRQES